MEDILDTSKANNIPKLSDISEHLKANLNNLKKKETERLTKLVEARGQLDHGFSVPANQLELNDIGIADDAAKYQDAPSTQARKEK